jgi:peptide/nickel transport system substrate-binding protein
MRTRNRGVASLAGAAALAVLIAGCGGSSSGGPGTEETTGGEPSAFQKLAPNSEGTPETGGTLNVLGVGDVDYMDPNVTYYSIGYSVARMYSRQLYSFPAEVGKWTEVRPDLATGDPEISSDGKTIKVTIKDGVNWNTSPPRAVTAADVVRGVKVTCNPSTPFGGNSNYSDLLVGFADFCKGFAKVQPNASAIAKYQEGNDFDGVSVDPSNPQTVVFKLTRAASYFVDQLALPAFSPRAEEMNDYVPGSAQLAQHTLSDGPYEIQSYNPAHQIVLVRNDDWDSATDDLRKAYVDKVVISETGDQDAITQQLQTYTPSADLSFDTAPNPVDTIQLINQNYPNLNVQGSISSNPYVVYNTVSPNNDGALAKVEVRQAISYALDRAHLIQDAGGPKLAPALTHVLPPEILGSKDFDLYPHDADKAKQMLADNGADGMKLTFLYRPESDTSKKMFQTIQNDLEAVGITVKGRGVPNADFYTKYLFDPDKAKDGTWDLSLAGWGPDWYGNAALSFFKPLYDGRALPPNSSNYGLFDSKKVSDLIDQASTEVDLDKSLELWGQADRAVMEEAAFFPITDPNGASLHGSQVHNTIYLPQFQTEDYTNVWLDPAKNGG